ncbi:uncharacterized protein NECHADRAFT_29856 [Fusarium vanettenii 77-13-4]|uniref:Zn(2)-C6 fungal-type domain-containing protein n=1 Tax=Fusarium vanettenii (strain ATCC MYA-4622 / CBS 123669 / FGSC 9596 / NRRL 45880 / 77-13-4) TaxID=660122 RepID=C7YW01_FUSV7|nr:uncharacterized protein NECHADRAFT_29856 [Fusarium vanettenii 77-13-4]EEU44089.1 hypothetical protein NECHADRAFT_29856 [Fusarium vanettenii 77-13-4]
MFGTWKYDPETDEVQSVRNGFDPVTARSSSHQACDRCHEKKLRCSGDKNGCERCRNNNLRCEYTRTGSKSSRRGKSSRKSAEGDSPSSSSSKRGGSSSKRSGKHHSGSSRAAASAEEGDGVLGQFDFSTLGPEDGFDLSMLSSAGADHGAGYATAGPSAGQYAQNFDGSYQQWDPAAYAAAYGQQQGYSGEDWGQYDQGDYAQDPRYYQGH